MVGGVRLATGLPGCAGDAALTNGSGLIQIGAGANVRLEARMTAIGARMGGVRLRI